MKEKAWTEVERHVGVEGDGTWISVGPDGDGLGCVRIRTVGEKNVKWFGAFDFNVSPALALALGQAIAACAAEQMKEAV
jgi:hypothetical protein